MNKFFTCFKDISICTLVHYFPQRFSLTGWPCGRLQLSWCVLLHFFAPSGCSFKLLNMDISKSLLTLKKDLPRRNLCKIRIYYCRQGGINNLLLYNFEEVFEFSIVLFETIKTLIMTQVKEINWSKITLIFSNYFPLWGWEGWGNY